MMKKRWGIALFFFLCCSLFAQSEWPLLQPEKITALSDASTTVVIRANVRKAVVYINGNFEGIGTTTVHNLVRGQYHLRIEKAGYLAQDVVFVVQAGCKQEFYITMQKEQA